MLNKTKYYRIKKSIKYTVILPLSFFIALLSHSSENTQIIDFYLPVHSSQFPDSLIQFQVALKRAGLNNINVKTADFWGEYQQSIRKGRSGIYLAAPHFASWAIHNHNFIPLLKLKDPLKYVIVSKRDNANIFEIRDLIHKDICTQYALNLDYLLISRVFQKKLQSAQPHIVRSVLEEIQKEASPCDAFSISEHAVLDLEQQFPNKHIRLAQSPAFNNFSIMIHPSLHKPYSESLTNLLQEERISNILSPILTLSSKNPILVIADKQDYPKNLSHVLKKYWQ